MAISEGEVMSGSDRKSGSCLGIALGALMALAPLASQAQESTSDVQPNHLKDAYFGETHVHTGVSMDAFIAGTRLTPDDAYRFAKGEEMMVNGSMHSIKRPLDFAAVTDHAEFIG